MTVFLGTLLSSIKQIKAPYRFDGEHGIALHGSEGNGPHLAARRRSHGFTRFTAETCGIFVSYSGEYPS